MLPRLPQHAWGCSGAPTPLPALLHDFVPLSSQNNIRDITDSLIEQCLDKNQGTTTAAQIPKEKIINIVNDLFGAGVLCHLSSAVAEGCSQIFSSSSCLTLPCPTPGRQFGSALLLSGPSRDTCRDQSGKVKGYSSAKGDFSWPREMSVG